MARAAACLWGAGLACAIAWAVQSGLAQDPGRLASRAGLLAATLVAAAFAARRLARLAHDPADPAARLHWDGEHWALSGRHALAQAEARVHLDLQSLMLLRLLAPDGRRWVWVTRGADRFTWLPLRRALYSAAPSHRDPASVSSPAHP